MRRKQERIKALEAEVATLLSYIDTVRHDLVKLGMEFNIHVYHEVDESLWERELSE
jgi:hypothetical protein